MTTDVHDDRPIDVDLWFDPACPWTWVTSRWLELVARECEVAVTWRPYSLLIKNGDDIPAQHRDAVEAGLRALRVIARLQAQEGNDAVAAFYRERGHRTFGDGGTPDVAEVLAAAGLDPTHAEAADDRSLDDAIRRSMDAAHRLAGASNGSPIVSVRGSGRGFFGPVLTSRPDPKTSVKLWEHLLGLFEVDELHELKRDRDRGPTPPPRL